MKKWVSILLVIVFAAAMLAGCSQPAAGGEGDASGGEAADGGAAVSLGDPNDEYYMVTFISGDVYWQDCYKGFQDAAAIFGAKTEYTGAQEIDVNQQITVLEQVAAKNPAGIAITCAEADALVTPINNIIDNGINLVAFDNDSPDSKRYTIAKTGNYEAGVQAAKAMGEQIGGEGTVAILFTAGVPSHEDRAAGVRDTLKELYPNLNIIDGNYAGDEADAASAVAGIIQANPDFAGAFTCNSMGAIGVNTAVKEAGKAGEVTIMGFDTNDTLIDLIRNGEVFGTVRQGAYVMGYWSFMYLYAMKNGLTNPVDGWQEAGLNPLPASMDTGVSIVNKENVDAFYPQ